MAQLIKLKRTAVSGKIPSTSNLELGELAMNTYDGRLFLKKSSSLESISEILTVNSHPRPITGSLSLNGAITASNFKGDGSQLTNLPPGEITEKTTVTASYDNVDDITVTHNFNSYNIIVSVYDNSRNVIIPATTSLPTTNTARVTLSDTKSGFVVVAKGGHLISGSQVADNAALLNGQNGAYYLNYSNFNNVPSGIVSSSAQVSTLTTHKETVSGASSYAVDHNLNEQYPIVQAWNTANSKQEIPASITTNSVNRVTVVFSTNFAGKIIVKK